MRFVRPDGSNYSRVSRLGHLKGYCRLEEVVLYCNVLYCTVLYCTVLYCTVLGGSLGLLAAMECLLQVLW